ncbi:hypothetical protein PoB_004734000 [Plakobranchus ocellatus]|uniref:Uncharacterized protein n=1 Tax=Plakobranchus ocellatus TaxID=259542 RepID=A0AAV4BP00_9GAST|nr:hypothetical protein PoB_004734000 [Plakobranchus ocellatus]
MWIKRDGRGSGFRGSEGRGSEARGLAGIRSKGVDQERGAWCGSEKGAVEETKEEEERRLTQIPTQDRMLLLIEWDGCRYCQARMFPSQTLKPQSEANDSHKINSTN